MSVLVCGEISLSAPQSSEWLDQYARELMRIAQRQNFYLMLDCNISQPCVFEMLSHFAAANNGRHLPFLITGSPLSNTSEEVVNMFSLGGMDSASQTRKCLDLLETFLKEAWIPDVRSMVIIIADGSAVSFQEVTASLSNFVDVTLSHFADFRNVPNLLIFLHN